MKRLLLLFLGIAAWAAGPQSLRPERIEAFGLTWQVPVAADWKLGPATTLELDGNYQTSAQRSASGYQLLGGTALPADPDPTLMLGHQPWQQPVSIRSTNASARLSHAFNEDWRLRLAAGRSRSVIDDNVAFAYGCWYMDACWSGSPPNYFAPDGSDHPTHRAQASMIRRYIAWRTVTSRTSGSATSSSGRRLPDSARVPPTESRGTRSTPHGRSRRLPSAASSFPLRRWAALLPQSSTKLPGHSPADQRPALRRGGSSEW